MCGRGPVRVRCGRADLSDRPDRSTTQPVGALAAGVGAVHAGTTRAVRAVARGPADRTRPFRNDGAPLWTQIDRIDGLPCPLTTNSDAPHRSGLRSADREVHNHAMNVREGCDSAKVLIGSRRVAADTHVRDSRASIRPSRIVSRDCGGVGGCVSSARRVQRRGIEALDAPPARPESSHLVVGVCRGWVVGGCGVGSSDSVAGRSRRETIRDGRGDCRRRETIRDSRPRLPAPAYRETIRDGRRPVTTRAPRDDS